ncbi:MAG: hypothetical protein K6G28_05740 [Acholeplasmatales bacterium]|nr:hypothetical protein [Acholeplasmatales bacterium]
MKRIIKSILIILHIALVALFVSSIVVRNKDLKANDEAELLRIKNPDCKTEQEYFITLNKPYEKGKLTQIVTNIQEYELSYKDLYLVESIEVLFNGDEEVDQFLVPYCYDANVGSIYGLHGNTLTANECMSVEELDTKNYSRFARLFDVFNALDILADIDNLKDSKGNSFGKWSGFETTPTIVPLCKSTEYIYKDSSLKLASSDIEGRFTTIKLFDDLCNEIVIKVSIR